MEIVNETGFSFGWIVGKTGPGAYTATFVVKGTFRMEHDAVAVPAEEHDPLSGDVFSGEVLKSGCVYDSDFALFKPKADILFAGKCHAPDAEPVAACAVEAEVGDWSKKLVVIGDRFWKSAAGMGIFKEITPPEPFSVVDLCHENSFGGEGFPGNPHGKGAAEEAIDGKTIRRLPNIEDPNNPVASVEDRPSPAGFAPLCRTWPQRMKFAGHYDEEWLEKRWPCFPDNFDYEYFNAAPEDMRLPYYLKGDETLRAGNMHPEHRDYRTRLPGMRTRLFFKEITEKGESFSELSLKLDTLWADMESEKLVLVWRGVREIRSEEMAEIENALIAGEPLDTEPLEIFRYRELLDTRLNELAAEEAEEPVEGVLPLDKSWTKEFEAAFLQLDRDFELLEAEAEKRKIPKKGGVPATGAGPAKKPPTTLGETIDSLKGGSNKLSDKTMALLEEFKKEFEETEDADSSERPELFPEPLTREACKQRHAAGEDFVEENLSGLDLSGMDLRGAIFRGAELQKTNFKGASLVEADFSEADLSGADFSGADLRSASIMDADATDACFMKADLSESTLDNSIFLRCDFREALLEKAGAFGALFGEGDFKNANFRGANLAESDFSDAVLENADFRESVLRSCFLEGVKARGADMRKADLSEANGSEGADFSGADFSESSAPESVWEGSVLDGADFSLADFQTADFSKASLKAARFNATNLKFSRFAGADLTDAVLYYANMFQASLEKALLKGAKIVSSNLYEVEF